MMTTKTIITLLAICVTAFPQSSGPFNVARVPSVNNAILKSVLIYCFAHWNRKFLCLGDKEVVFRLKVLCKFLFSRYLVDFKTYGELLSLKIVSVFVQVFFSFFSLTSVSFRAVTAFEALESKSICFGERSDRKRISVNMRPNELAIPFLTVLLANSLPYSLELNLQLFPLS